jgi:2,3-bisphosphoglycerate-dependent phosphoglycerate mutase
MFAAIRAHWPAGSQNQIPHERRRNSVLSDVFLVRHGEPNRTTGIPYRAPPGPGLCEQGRNEARQAAAFLADKQIEHVFVSPYTRAMQTAEELVAQLALPQSTAPLIAEYRLDETEEQLRARMAQFAAELVAAPYTRVAVVSHAAPIGELLLEMTQQPREWLPVNEVGHPLPTGGIWHVWRVGEAWEAALVFPPEQPH